MSNQRLNAADTAELASLLGVLTDWISDDFDTLDISLSSYLDRNGFDVSYDADHLRADLRRLRSALGVRDTQADF